MSVRIVVDMNLSVEWIAFLEQAGQRSTGPMLEIRVPMTPRSWPRPWPRTK
jgi:hypothetical protein